MRFAIFFFILSFLFNSCRKDQVVDKEVIQVFLHLGHTRTNQNGIFDKGVKKIDFSKYDMLWLGGDLSYLSSINSKELKALDSIFYFSKSTTLWALGNHDYSNPDLISNITNRATYYAFYKDGISFLVLDNQLDSGRFIGAQLDLIENVLDTISESSHLIILSHKLIWMYGNENLEPDINLISNGIFGDCSYCLNPNNFYEKIYPKLIELEENNIEVICVAGDIGSKVKEFSYKTIDGIDFLASGIKANETGNLALVFNYYQKNKKLYWYFEDLNNLD